jgi:transcriptional regulator with PAS, ATPase and Fis domain
MHLRAFAPESVADVEASVELLRTIADVLDIRSVFPRVSEIAQSLLPHDAMVMVFFDERGKIALEAATPNFPNVRSHVAPSPVPELLIGDLAVEPLRVASGDNPTHRLLEAGLRSVLSVVTRARDQVMSVVFFSEQPHAFSVAERPMARRISDLIALAVSHEQLAEAAQQLAEARTRAEQLEARVEMLTETVKLNTHGHIAGESREWREVLKRAAQVAPTDTTVLLTGESGTGKEVVARLIHRASGRATGPFVAINCAALPEQLLESELFGYERGAFTSAHQAKPGHIELASGGVLFLDEVTEMSPASQAKFLRVLQEREFQRLGGTRLLRANIRVVAATNRDLWKAVQRGDFRRDLYYRLAVFDLRLAPLRERRGDIMALSEVFLGEIARSFGRPPAGLTKHARQTLLDHDWPGNVRELRNALERAAILADGGLIDAEHLSLRRDTLRLAAHSSTDLSTVEHDTIVQVLRDTEGNKSLAAKRLGLTRTQLYGRMRKYGLMDARAAETASK